ncbi:MAG: AAA family ATPase [Ectothiorhodospiraceae bacterium AqS1]|nr:AAA family ATPase [Ectothiorhodospiraceae bacterium AqS1]
MPTIEGIRIKNFRSLKNITFGKLWSTQDIDPLTPLTVVIGKNGAGKSALFDAFGFLADCLKAGVEEACDARGRGGFDRIRSQGEDSPIAFEIYYRESKASRPITYELEIDKDENQRAFVLRERLRQRRQGQTRGRPFSFLMLENGQGVAWKGDHLAKEEDKKEGTMLDFIQAFFLDQERSRKESPDTQLIDLSDNRKLGIAGIASLAEHPRFASFCRFIEGWYLSYFTPAAARDLPMAGPQRHLNIRGDNLANVVEFMEREHKDRLGEVLKRIAGRIPGIESIDTKRSEDGRLLLCFNDSGFSDPFYAQQISDGTLKVFAYLLLLADPSPVPFICIEEPSSGLYHKLLDILAHEFREHATGGKKGTQIFATTHQPYFVDALRPEEVWILEKNESGFSSISRASDNAIVKAMTEEGLPLGGLWYSDYLDTR